MAERVEKDSGVNLSAYVTFHDAQVSLVSKKHAGILCIDMVEIQCL